MLKELGRQSVQRLRELPDVALVDEGVFVYHGIPANDLVCLLKDVYSGLPVLKGEAAIVS